MSKNGNRFDIKESNTFAPAFLYISLPSLHVSQGSLYDGGRNQAMTKFCFPIDSELGYSSRNSTPGEFAYI